MIPRLDEIEARVLGALIEKSLTIPEQYPLSMNALVTACNQKTSRDPVLSLDEATVGRGLHSLITQSLAGRLHEPGSRVPKFMHHAEILVGGSDAKVVGVACVLLLRGPQTPGELKSRTERLCEFASTAEVESLLSDLAARSEPLVAKLPRQPGQKESRYRHLFGADAPAAATPAPTPAASEAAAAGAAAAPDRLAELERRVAALEELVKSLVPTRST